MVVSLANLKALLIDSVPRWLLGSIFLIGAVDGFVFIFTGTHLIHPPTSSAGLSFEAALKDAGFL